jgi:hypothetical protein
MANKTTDKTEQPAPAQPSEGVPITVQIKPTEFHKPRRCVLALIVRRGRSADDRALDIELHTFRANDPQGVHAEIAQYVKNVTADKLTIVRGVCQVVPDEV